jgi:hypothetical protein
VRGPSTFARRAAPSHPRSSPPVELGQVLDRFDEHEKRAWSVDFCRSDPTLLASGSDDAKGALRCALAGTHL